MTETIKGKILVVDDELIMRELLTDYLEMSDFEVISAENGVEALNELENNKDISLVISDINMPKMGGVELQENIKKLYPELSLIFMTGYGIEKIKKDLEGKAQGFLAKPFELEDLYGLVSKILNVEII